MTTKKIKSSDILGDNYYIYELTSSNYNPNPNNTITITCTVKNVYGDLIANKAVQLYQNDVAIGNAATTNNNGIATWTITCSNSGVQKFSVKNTIIEVFVKESTSASTYLTESDLIDDTKYDIDLDISFGLAGLDDTITIDMDIVNYIVDKTININGDD